jgi:phage I-like protein
VFYPTDFSWRDGADGGVFCRGVWSQEGKRAVESGEFKSFSPVFAVNKRVKPPYPIVCLITAGSNMGGLTNEAAFGELLRLRVTDS